MELLIKVKEYDKYFILLYESKLDKDWNIFLEELSKNRELLEKFKEYIKVKNCGFLLKKYLTRFSCLEFQSNFNFQRVYYEILKYVSENCDVKNFFLKNLITNQIIKLAFMDKSGEYKELLNMYISENNCKEEWIEELLKIVKLNEALGIYYEKNEKYDEALNIYKQYFPENLEKIEKLNEKVRELSNEVSNEVSNDSDLKF
jgi:hypothetical protein